MSLTFWVGSIGITFLFVGIVLYAWSLRGFVSDERRKKSPPLEGGRRATDPPSILEVEPTAEKPKRATPRPATMMDVASRGLPGTQLGSSADPNKENTGEAESEGQGPTKPKDGFDRVA